MKASTSHRFIRIAPGLAALVSLFISAAPAWADDAEKTPLVLKLPDPTVKGTPADLPTGPNIEPPADKPPVFLVPKGVVNVASGKPVTASVVPFVGDLSQLTDGKKEPEDSDTVEMKKGAQWVQVDLGGPYSIYAIALWHDHRYLQLVHGVAVQVSNDPEFKTGVTTLFNNDRENANGLGAGQDKQYFETNLGKIVDGKGEKARYVRCYTHGTSSGALNAWEEVEVYGLPAK